MVLNAMTIFNYAKINMLTIDHINNYLQNYNYNSTVITEIDSPVVELDNNSFSCYVCIQDMPEYIVNKFKNKYPDVDNKYNNILLYKDGYIGFVYAS